MGRGGRVFIGFILIGGVGVVGVFIIEGIGVVGEVVSGIWIVGGIFTGLVIRKYFFLWVLSMLEKRNRWLYISYG